MTLSLPDVEKTKEWIKKIKRYSEDDILPAMNLEERAGGYYSTIQLIFSYIDTFGAHFTGTQSSESATEFIKKYLGKVNLRYKEIAGILYSVFRHGTVHTSHPKRFIVNGTSYISLVGGKNFEICADDSKFKWKEDQGGDGQIYTHLEPISPAASHPLSKYSNVRIFPISIVRLYSDYKDAVSHYINDLENDPTLQELAFGMMEKIKEPTEFINVSGEVEEVHPLRRSGREIREYIEVAELSNL